MSPVVITFGRSDGTAIKSVFPETRAFALLLANSLSYVFFKTHEFKNSECHTDKRIERDGWFVEFAIRRPRTKFGRLSHHQKP